MCELNDDIIEDLIVENNEVIVAGMHNNVTNNHAFGIASSSNNSTRLAPLQYRDKALEVHQKSEINIRQTALLLPNKKNYLY